MTNADIAACLAQEVLEALGFKDIDPRSVTRFLVSHAMFYAGKERGAVTLWVHAGLVWVNTAQQLGWTRGTYELADPELIPKLTALIGTIEQP